MPTVAPGLNSLRAKAFTERRQGPGRAKCMTTLIFPMHFAIETSSTLQPGKGITEIMHRFVCSGRVGNFFTRRVLTALAVCLALAGPSGKAATPPKDSSKQRRLYVAVPGIRNYLEYGGHGLLVFDIDQEHRFVKRIPTGGLDDKGQPGNVKGICAHAETKRIFITTPQSLMALDLVSEKMLWEKKYEGGCDRMALAPDGSHLYVPSFEKDHWHVISADTGEVLHKVNPQSGAHNTIYGPDGTAAYLAGLKSPLLSVTEARNHTIAKTVGPFSASIRPFTINGSQTLCYVNVNDLLGFEIGDLKSGEKLHRVEVTGYTKGPTKRHGCPSHGIALTLDEKEIWLTDAANSRLHIFDATRMPPVQTASIALRDQPGWITLSIDGRLAYPSTGEVIDVRTRKILGALKDETGRDVQSEKMLEIDFVNGKPTQAGNQFAIGGGGRMRATDRTATSNP
jgi:hypothetical protein